MNTSKTMFFTLISLSIILQSSAFVILELSSENRGIIKFTLFMLAVLFVLIRAFFWQKLLTVAALSKAYPFTLLTQVIIVLYGVFLFDEDFSAIKGMGMVIILAGLLVIHKKAR
ncbi:hypothetical protein BM527_16495 [Alteromonas sp. Mex14]|nr:hypothetical protein BM527_16495 [Alteromonas sp. Mex14]